MASSKVDGSVKKRPSGDLKNAEDHHAKNCCICCEEVKVFAIGACDHPICYKCSARMRVLSNQTYCATCRAEMKEVVVSFQKKKFGDFTLKNMKIKRGGGFYFEEWRLAEYFDTLFDHVCSECPDLEKPFGSFDDLKTHIRRSHDKQFCQICLDALSNFPSELKMYTKKELVIHRKEGDVGDRSHRGHPECKFCNDRFVDNDTLLFHLRKSHFWCHFCEHDGKQEYYNVYKDLRSHFGEFHFLCDEGECRYEKFTSVFRDKIDYQAHKLAAHGKNFNKMQAKEARKIEFDYSYRKRQPTSVVTGSDYAEVNSSELKQPRGDSFNTRRGNQNTMDFSNFEDVERERQELRREKESQLAKAKSPETERINRDANKAAASVSSSGEQPCRRLVDDGDIIGLPEHINKPENEPETIKQSSKSQQPKKESSIALTKSVHNKPNNRVENKSSPKITEDFPLLPGGVPTPNLSSSKKSGEEEFPALRKPVKTKEFENQKLGNKPEITHLNGIPVTVKKKNDKGKSWTQQSGRANMASTDDFPSLKSIDLNQNVEDNKNNKANSKPSNTGNKTPNHEKNLSKNSRNANGRPPPGLNERSNGASLSNGKGPPGFQSSASRKVEDVPPGFGSTSGSMENKIRERNVRLYALLETYLDDFNLQVFKNISGDFRKDKTPASEYYSAISELLGENLKYLFSELVALLPDEKKRNELLKVHQNAKVIAKQREDSTVTYSTQKRNVWGSSPQSQSRPAAKEEETWCADCGQTFSREDSIQHMESHGEAFPSLPKATQKKKFLPFKTVHQSQTKNAWGR